MCVLFDMLFDVCVVCVCVDYEALHFGGGGCLICVLFDVFDIMFDVCV